MKESRERLPETRSHDQREQGIAVLLYRYADPEGKYSESAR